MDKPPVKTKQHIQQKKPIFRGKGFSVQLFLITILPLTVLLLAVAFGSQTLHQRAMRDLVGDRDLQTVRATANSLDRELAHLSSILEVLARSADGKADLSGLILSPKEIAATFDGGLALYANDGSLLHATSTDIDWQGLPVLLPGYFSSLRQAAQQPIFSTPVTPAGSAQADILIGMKTADGRILAAAFSPEILLVNVISDLIGAGQTTVLVVSPAGQSGAYAVLYAGGPLKLDAGIPAHPGIQEALQGKSGIRYYQSSAGGEHVVAYSPISPTGWGLIIEEAWEDISSPYLSYTQAAPLIVVPILLVALFIIWFGARRIVAPLQELEQHAADLAAGNFDAIQQPVGGIAEIQHLQAEMAEMARTLKAAQQNLRSYIGAITAGIENERRNLALELHDDTIQSLIALNQRIQMNALYAPEAQKGIWSELQGFVQQTMANLRHMIRGLRPIYLEDLGLAASLQMLVGEMAQTTQVPIDFTLKGIERRLDSQKELFVYRMVQESLNNVLHHAEAGHAWVEIEFDRTGLAICIRDDGNGFAVPNDLNTFASLGHFGLLGLKERAELIHADLEVRSAGGQGTTISIRLEG